MFFLARVQVYEESCRELDITSDWQIKTLLPYDTISIADRSFSFNTFRAFSTAIEANLESLTLHSVGLTSRSLEVLCQGLNKCVRLQLLVKKKRFINYLHMTLFSFVRTYQIIKLRKKVFLY